MMVIARKVSIEQHVDCERMVLLTRVSFLVVMTYLSKEENQEILCWLFCSTSHENDFFLSHIV